MDDTRNYLLGLFNTKIAQLYLKAFNSTITLQVKDVKSLPIILSEPHKPKIDQIAEENISLSKTDWDSFETSWDFKKHPLL